MTESDRDEFYRLIPSVYAFYRQDCSTFALSVWWEGCKPFDLAAVKDALNRHAVNPDNGQFCPKPADVVRLIGGGTMDGALLAWSQVDRAVRSVGPYQTVVFDDPIIHAVISDMGGWVEFGKWDEDEWPFKAKEFETRYRAFRTRGKLEHGYPAKLLGIVDMENGDLTEQQVPTLIGDPVRAAWVLNGGGTGPSLQVTSGAVAQAMLEAPAP